MKKEKALNYFFVVGGFFALRLIFFQNMAGVVLKALSAFCNFGGPFIAPFITPILHLINVLMLPASCSTWTILLVSCFVPIYYSNPNQFNSVDKQNKNAARSFGFASLFYYVSMVIIFCIVMQFTCTDPMSCT